MQIILNYFLLSSGGCVSEELIYQCLALVQSSLAYFWFLAYFVLLTALLLPDVGHVTVLPVHLHGVSLFGQVLYQSVWDIFSHDTS